MRTRRGFRHLSLPSKLSAFGALIGTLSLMASILGYLLAPPEMRDLSDRPKLAIGMNSNGPTHPDEYKDLRGRLEAMEAQLKAALEATPTLELAASVAALQASSKELDGRLREFESALVSTPAKALSIPLLRQDLDGLKGSIPKAVDECKAQSDRVYDLAKWFLALVATMAVGLIGTTAGVFLQLRAAPRRETDKPDQGPGPEERARSLS